MSGPAGVFRSLADRLVRTLMHADLEPVPLDRVAAIAPSFERACPPPERALADRERDERERTIIILTAAWM